MKKILIIILAHDNQSCLEDMVENVKFYCPNVNIALYNSGDDKSLGNNLPIKMIKPRRRLYYAHIVPFFFDLFEWLDDSEISYDYVINLDSDVLFIRRGFEEFIIRSMKGFDYMAPDLRLNAHTRPKWRPMRSLKPEMQKWYEFLGFDHLHGAFNPGQTFSRKYIQKLFNHPKYKELLTLVNENQSYTLHEVLFPTLVDFLELKGKSYPEELNTTIRYRPYQAVSGIKRAISINTAFFVHPVRRDLTDPARVFIKERMSEEMER